jgi:hypothetical protein
MTITLSPGQSLRISPALIPISISSGNEIISNALYKYWRSTYHSTFHAQGLYWVFYGKYDTSLYWKTSLDGITWSSEHSISGAGGTVHYIDVCEQNNYVHIVYRQGPYALYRGGLLRGDGNITWSAGSWTVAVNVAPSGTQYLVGAISIQADYDGYPYLLYELIRNDGYECSTRVFKSTTNNGIWTQGPGWWLVYDRYQGPYNESTLKGGISLVSFLNDDKLYALVNYLGSLRGIYYDGNAWSYYMSGPPYVQQGTYDLIAGGGNNLYFNGVADELDNIHIVTQDISRADRQISYVLRHFNGSLTSLVIDNEPGGNISPGSICYDAITAEIRIIYCKSGQFKCAVIGRDLLQVTHSLNLPDIFAVQVAATPYITPGVGNLEETGFIFVDSSSTYYGWVTF